LGLRHEQPDRGLILPGCAAGEREKGQKRTEEGGEGAIMKGEPRKRRAKGKKVV